MNNMIPEAKPLRKSILTGGALSAALWHCLHNIWKCNISLALKVSIMIWIIPPGLNVTNATPHSIYSVGHGNQQHLSEARDFFVLSSAADSFNVWY